jgi:hypothetical protein
MHDETLVTWREWGADAFEEARERGRPILLSLTAAWCGECHEMDAGTYGDPVVAARVADGFVPVRANVDRHPRVRERYNMGGFPSTVFLAPDGRLLTGATYLGPEGMRQVLDSVGGMWDERGGDAASVPRALAGDPTPAGDLDPRIERHLAGQLTEKYDERFAGWGDDAKFPLPRTVEFALTREREQALATLEAVERNLLDDAEGGFFRFAGGRDWSDPHREKLLDANATLLRAFVNAYLYTGRDAYRRPAERTIEYLVESLWTGAGFGGGEAPALDGGESDVSAPGGDPAGDRRGDAAEASGGGRAGRRRDLTAYAGANALAADALLAYHALTDDERARTYAIRALEYLDSRLVDDGVVTHYRDRGDAGESGLLEDHARVASAFARATQVLGPAYLDTARAVADSAVERLHDEGSFRDGPAEGPGLLDRPLRPLDANVEMADALVDLSLLTGEARYRERAAETVGAFAGAWDRIGVQVAGYGALVGRLCEPTLVVEVGGDPGSDLHRAALRVADHEKVVRPGADLDAGVASVRLGDRSRTAGTPEDLMAAVTAVRESDS